MFGISFSQFVVQTQMYLYIILRLPPRLAKRRLVYVISAFWREKNCVKVTRVYMLSAVLNIKKYCQKFYRWLFPSSDQLCSILSEGKYFFCNELETIEHFFINCNYLDDVWLRVTNTFKSCGMSKVVRSLQYLVIGYKTWIIEYKWINV